MLKAPFPWFGGKSRVAHLVWPRFGDVPNYVEPFAGSLAVLLARPFSPRTETVNDRDAYLANFWRATQADPEAVAHFADWPVNEADLHARHLWLVNQADFRERMLTDPDYFDAKIAGWWVWGQSAWIGSGWCDISLKSDKAGVATTDGRVRPELKRPKGVTTHNGRSRPNLRPAQGVEGVVRQIPDSRSDRGVHSVSRQIPSLQGDSGASGGGVHAKRVQSDLYAYMTALSERLRRVRVVCGDWTRIMGPSVTYKIGVTGIFLDPPYGDTRQDGLYAVDSLTVADEVRAWCLVEIDDAPHFTGPRYLHPKLRIALCGLDGEHNELEALGWDVIPWKASGGYGNQRRSNDNENAGRERIWFSPHCLSVEPKIAQASWL
jgi:hypothetical protein